MIRCDVKVKILGVVKVSKFLRELVKWLKRQLIFRAHQNGAHGLNSNSRLTAETENNNIPPLLQLFRRHELSERNPILHGGLLDGGGGRHLRLHLQAATAEAQATGSAGIT